jgi:hypothetical protein
MIQKNIICEFFLGEKILSAKKKMFQEQVICGLDTTV